jgi:hypothetical protein
MADDVPSASRRSEGSPVAAPLQDRARGAVTLAAPALLLYAGLRVLSVLVLWAYAAADGRNLLGLLTRWDAVHYAGIVTRGYDAAIPLKPDGSLAITNLAFFPLFPWLVDVVDTLPGVGVGGAQLLVAWTAGLAAAWGLYALGTHLRDRRTGIVLAGLWAVLPHALVESMGYTETLFTALAVWSLLAVLQARWLTAGVLCLLAGLTRPTAAALIVAVGLAALAAVWQRPSSWRPWAAMVLAPLGLLGYLGWVGVRLGRMDGYLHVQNDAWRMSFDGGASTWDRLGQVLTRPQPLALYVTTAVVIVSVALFVLAAGDRVPWPLLAYSLVLLLMVIAGTEYYHAKGRMLVPAVPLLLPVAYALAAARTRTLVVVFALFTSFSAWYGVYLCLVWTGSP